MEIIFIGRPGRSPLHLGSALSLVFLAALIAGGAAVFEAGRRTVPAPEDPRPDIYSALLDEATRMQRERVEGALESTRMHLDALAAQVGALRARTVRLDALGRRLVTLSKLDPGEFDFTRAPALGGPDPGSAAALIQVPDLMAELADVAALLDDRAPKLALVEEELMGERLESRVVPSGRPTDTGWISSGYGQRLDPATGRRALHEGVDFAGRGGTHIKAVASGVVVYAGRRKGYGRVVEVHHGYGFTTRYAHNRKNLVKVGHTVRKGEVVALMGASGRVTGTHLHFEVRKDGRALDPMKFIRDPR